MKQYVISDNLDSLTGMRLAGIDGVLVQETKDFRPNFDAVIKDKDYGIVMISPALIEANQEIIDEVRFNQATPLIVELQGPKDFQTAENQIAKTIRQAIGISI
ncbi:V-type ATP synthase subunit F [Aerococcus sanguinicola]|uniref:V-type ATP synthase subunit F n=1 Tax=unclassified Aerococcus TaxID=2618060 RepID=UPI0008A50629|nr:MULTISPECIES: V-type ATP synthase subunit F [unclassified Aerococcus]MDK6232778.1 V-type ATP synthase subunit F [Aerococcus sp. UMB10185]MDK6805273.1 V-type ATP synthase subunit F [Aerococcus sp. UMB7834]MDK6854932.1 V-type ATP synthase subunit F [Aerococcus sp. UMB7533]MDK8501802.1 V-type ATP synthase subunit F [Aerococcus sp. UMB1112A]OFN02690.1 ATP synthase [Aerococcus sp. HMSC062A02]